MTCLQWWLGHWNLPSALHVEDLPYKTTQLSRWKNSPWDLYWKRTLFLPPGVNDVRGQNCPIKPTHLKLPKTTARGSGFDSLCRPYLIIVVEVFTPEWGIFDTFTQMGDSLVIHFNDGMCSGANASISHITNQDQWRLNLRQLFKLWQSSNSKP